jgi:hypothetical protein
MGSGFRIFAAEKSLSAVPARRYNIGRPDPSLMTIFLHPQIVHPGQYDSGLKVTIKTETDLVVESETLSLTFDRPEIPSIFSFALLGGLLVVFQTLRSHPT